MVRFRSVVLAAGFVFVAACGETGAGSLAADVSSSTSVSQSTPVPDSTPDPESTPASTGTVETSTTASVTDSSPVSTKTARTGEHHLVWSGMYLGIWDGQSWSGPEDVFDEAWKLPAGVELVPTDGGEAYPAVPVDDPCASVEGPRDAGAITDLAWEPVPRSFDEVSAAPAHIEAVQRILVAEGLVAPAEGDVRVLRVDLEGDGIDEVIVEAEASSGTYVASRAGDHSLVMLRRVVDGDVVENPLFVSATTEAEAEEAGPTDFDPSLSDATVVATTTSGIADLNGDGTMEIIVRRRGDHSAWFAVFDVTRSAMDPVLSVGCGW